MPKLAKQRILVFMRYPRAGATKTRLIPALGADGAAALHRAMAEYTVETVAQLGISFTIHHAGADEADLADWLGADLAYRAQQGGDLGDRMRAALEAVFMDGVEKAILIGTDCPELAAATIARAVDRLDGSDLVLGPAHDGGYYLIGLHARARHVMPRLFETMPWGTDRVLRETCDRAESLRCSMALLEPLADVDRPEDIPVWQRVHATWPAISVVIPALNEEAFVDDTLRAAASSHAESVVVDGGSDDGTVARVAARSVRVIQGPRGRAAQMNVGARESHGAILLFLHADSRLPAGYARHVRLTMNVPGVSGGAFRFATDIQGSASMTAFTHIANWRASLLRLPYGDQALFTTRGMFERVGGFPEIPLMDDVELVRRLRRHGRIGIAPVAVTTSGRRWRAKGIWRTMALNQAIMLAYAAGVGPDRLARWYRGKA